MRSTPARSRQSSPTSPPTSSADTTEVTFRAVLFDWRGTLVTTLDEDAWAAEALRRLGRDDEAAPLAAALRSVADLLDAPGVDTDAALHRRTYLDALAGLGLDDDLAE